MRLRLGRGRLAASSSFGVWMAWPESRLSRFDSPDKV